MSEGDEFEVEKKKITQSNENFIKDKKFASIDDMIDLTVNLNKLKTKDDFDILKVYAERIKDSLMQALIREKEHKERVKQFEEINNNVDINLIIKERDEFKAKFLNEVKKHNQSRITIESQKRVINSKINHSPNHQ
jgi:predicted RND superfamily exporter protein